MGEGREGGVRGEGCVGGFQEDLCLDRIPGGSRAGGGGGRLGGRVSRKTHALKEFQGVSGHGRGEFCTSSPFVVVHA